MRVLYFEILYGEVMVVACMKLYYGFLGWLRKSA